MRFTQAQLPGVWLVESDLHEDSRGSFARVWCADEARQHGLDGACLQCNLSFNRRRGTLRGLHWQAEPAGEAKWVRCVRGAVWDVAVDIRAQSPYYCRWVGFEISASNRRMLYIPPGMAHGFQSLEDDTELLYIMSTPYAPQHARGARWNDPAFGIHWPIADVILSDRDRDFEDFRR